MQTFGGALFKPIAELICGIADIVIEVLQNTFITYKTNVLATETPTGIRDYTIRYSPGIIFSGEVRSLDINFINPKEDQPETQYKIEFVKVADTLEEAQELGIMPKNANDMQSGHHGNSRWNMLLWETEDKYFSQWTMIEKVNGEEIATTYYWIQDVETESGLLQIVAALGIVALIPFTWGASLLLTIPIALLTNEPYGEGFYKKVLVENSGEEAGLRS